MTFRNSTGLDGERLLKAFLAHTAPYKHDPLRVSVRYSRGADFSGTCYYRDARIFVNIGRHVRYPYALGTHVARAVSNRTHWWREIYHLTIGDAYQLALFVYLHELYHYLVKAAGRNPRAKESRCDRFAARVLVEHYGCKLLDRQGRLVDRRMWDFQDTDRFVSRAPRVIATAGIRPAPVLRPIPVRITGLRFG